MPVYEYVDAETGRTIELRRPVAERDAVAAGLRRVTVPRRVAIHGTGSGPRDPESAAAQVPAGLKALSNREVNGMVRESGMTVDQFKEAWGL